MIRECGQYPRGQYPHDWESGRWGVIVGVSRCRSCGIVCKVDDFRYTPESDDSTTMTWTEGLEK